MTGLTSEQAKERQAQYGRNVLEAPKRISLPRKILSVIKEPMFLLLLVATVVYFALGEVKDGIWMLFFVFAIIGIDAVQEWKTDKTLAALRQLAEPHVAVLRDGEEKIINSADLVPGDIMRVSEGVKIPADGVCVEPHDLCVDESTLTGEPEGVWKNEGDAVYAGTLALQGLSLVEVTAIGTATVFGGIGKQVAEAPDRPTPLEKQVGKLIKLMAGIAAVFFALVTGFSFMAAQGTLGDRATHGLLAGVTLAMALIPEEFPVILTVFLSMGAWRLAKRQSLVRRLSCVETLGAVSVLCVDKTGTITQNRMTVCDTWTPGGDTAALIETMGLACEEDAYDPMEKAMVTYCGEQGFSSEHLFGGELLHEYAFTNERKMMGHVWRHEGALLVAAKGSPERLLPLCGLPESEAAAAEATLRRMSGQGLRVIAVGVQHPDAIPADLPDCRLTLCGLIGLADPPRESVVEDIRVCHRAGVRVVMITGDSADTALAIARSVGIVNDADDRVVECGMRNTEYRNDENDGSNCVTDSRSADNGANGDARLIHFEDTGVEAETAQLGAPRRVITGAELDAMDDEALAAAVGEVNVFARVVPAHKMRIVQALKSSGAVVAMTGDGVNDAPALKYADIGVAMGKRGSEVSREAADIVLMDDNFSTIVNTVADGRRIYDNIRKAVAYTFAIHIPIGLVALLCPLLGVPALLLPLHVVVLELFIDPTCSIVLERQPAERALMARPPRDPKEALFSPPSIAKSVLQGLTLFAGVFGAYLWFLPNEALARSMALAVMLLGNLFLVQVNSSARESVVWSLSKLLWDKVMWAINIGTLALLAIILYTPVRGALALTPLTGWQLLIALLLAAALLWWEVVKWVGRVRDRRRVRRAKA